jgi:hypothetical protein
LGGFWVVAVLLAAVLVSGFAVLPAAGLLAAVFVAVFAGLLAAVFELDIILFEFDIMFELEFDIIVFDLFVFELFALVAASPQAKLRTANDKSEAERISLFFIYLLILRSVQPSRIPKTFAALCGLRLQHSVHRVAGKTPAIHFSRGRHN